MTIEATVRGNLTKDPEQRTVLVDGEQRTLVDCRVFSDEYKRAGDDLVQDDDRCTGVDVTIWSEHLGQQAMKLLRKGMRVEVRGDMSLHRYKDRETGEPRSGLQMNANSLTLALNRVEGVEMQGRREVAEAG